MLPLDDVKVVDFMWALAGPGTTRTIADYGATVVRIESASRVDGARTVGPFFDNKPAHDGSGLFGTYNSGKLGLALDLSKPRARKSCLIWCDGPTSFANQVFAQGDAGVAARLRVPARSQAGRDNAQLMPDGAERADVELCWLRQYGQRP